MLGLEEQSPSADKELGWKSGSDGLTSENCLLGGREPKFGHALCLWLWPVARRGGEGEGGESVEMSTGRKRFSWVAASGRGEGEGGRTRIGVWEEHCLGLLRGWSLYHLPEILNSRGKHLPLEFLLFLS